MNRKPQPMTKWLEPRVLLHSAQEVVLSGLFANFADKRESMAGADPTDHGGLCFDYSGEDSGTFWFDYASDVGDGFNPTYAIARLLAGNSPTETERGRFLVLGGDQVYPSASWERYDERFRYPYEEASKGLDPADMYVIPGNHDWYDGLTSFTRLFCQRASIGAWQTRQGRSYFAIKLPYNWWLWGIDIQFDAYIDGPQVDYFTRVAEQTEAGDKIILATAKPSWVQVEADKPPPQSWKSLAWFDDHVICKNGARLALTITGDLHHYARYDQSAEEQDGVVTTVGAKLTAGGGGAFLSPTHQLPLEVDLPASTRAGSDEPPATTVYTRRREWPDVDTSRRLALGFLRHLSPAETWKLGKVLAVVYLLAALLVAVGVKDRDTSFTDSLDAGFGALVLDSITVWLVLAAIGLAAGLRAWAIYGEARGAMGLLHWAAQFAVAWLGTILVLGLLPQGLADDGFWHGYLTALVMAVVGVVVGRWLLVAYLFLSHRINPRWHANEVFAAQHREDYKHFLRFKLDGTDALTVYVVGLRDVSQEPELIEVLAVQAPPPPR
ncbi:metallophosphoesterase [Solirubrobacter taibaiensis]|nr:metallophosphoesterase [Solirubrobacter taibaiensis]